LFEINGRQVWPRAETLLVSPFREIWERDKGEGKEDALGELAFIEFCTSAKRSNPFGQYPDSVREEVVAREVVRREGWRPDGLVREGMEKVRRMQEEGSDAYRYYMSARAAVEKVAAFLNGVDLSERNAKTGSPLYKPSDVTRALNDLEKNLSNLNALEKKVREELFEGERNRGDKKVSPFAEAF